MRLCLRAVLLEGGLPRVGVVEGWLSRGLRLGGVLLHRRDEGGVHERVAAQREVEPALRGRVPRAGPLHGQAQSADAADNAAAALDASALVHGGDAASVLVDLEGILRFFKFLKSAEEVELFVIRGWVNSPPPKEKRVIDTK